MTGADVLHRYGAERRDDVLFDGGAVEPLRLWLSVDHQIGAHAARCEIGDGGVGLGLRGIGSRPRVMRSMILAASRRCWSIACPATGPRVARLRPVGHDGPGSPHPAGLPATASDQSTIVVTRTGAQRGLPNAAARDGRTPGRLPTAGPCRAKRPGAPFWEGGAILRLPVSKRREFLAIRGVSLGYSLLGEPGGRRTRLGRERMSDQVGDCLSCGRPNWSR